MIISLINWRIISSFSLIFSNKIFYHDKEKIYFKKILKSHFLAIFFIYTIIMSKLENENIITNKIKIEISQLKIICYFFSKDFTASQTAKAINISRQTINNYYKIFREIAFNNGFSQKCVDKFIDLNNSEDIDSNELLNLMNNLVDCKKIYN